MTPRSLVQRTADYLAQYITLSSPDYYFAAALWVIGTYLWPSFDAYAYLTITSYVKRSGKSRFLELLAFLSANPRNFAAMTPAGIFRSIKDENPTIFIDEAETLASESASFMRSVLNVGYRRGQTIPRMGQHGIEEWPAYCPKVFALIGDTFDTLRDRSIVFTLERAAPRRRFLYEEAKADAALLAEEARVAIQDQQHTMLAWYASPAARLPFLMDRDEEIWLPLFAIASALCPERLVELQRVAVDLATEKTQDARSYIDLRDAEGDADAQEYGQRLLHDLHSLYTPRSRVVYTKDAIERLKAIPTAPWRKFRARGLTPETMAGLLTPLGCRPGLVKTGRKSTGLVIARGYRREDVERALRGLHTSYP